MRKLLIAAIVLILTVSSLVSVAAVSAVVHRRSHADFIREASWHQTRAHYMFAAQVTPLPPAEAPVQPIPPERS